MGRRKRGRKKRKRETCKVGNEKGSRKIDRVDRGKEEGEEKGEMAEGKDKGESGEGRGKGKRRRRGKWVEFFFWH